MAEFKSDEKYAEVQSHNNPRRARMEAALTEGSEVGEIARHQQAVNRFDVLTDYLAGKISAEVAMETLLVRKSRFYKLLRYMKGAKSYRALVCDQSGRKPGLTVIHPETLKLIEEMFEEHYPAYKTVAGVWKHCQAQADNRRMLRPSYHTVATWIKAKNESLLHQLTHQADQNKQRYGAKPGYKVTTRPLEWVQIDHTVVDLMVVDEDDRTIVLGRPYISVAVDLHTRVVLGFYVSLLPPSAVSVAMLMESCALPKTAFLQGLGVPEHLLPYYGLPEVIHTDNAKEFVSDVFVLNAEDFGIKVEHRDIPAKHQGGHIESLIGKLMLRTMHSLPGTTGSNAQQGKHLKSHKNAAIGLAGLRRIVAYTLHAYHQTKHSELGKTPAEAWEGHFAKKPHNRVLDVLDHDDFKYRFYPEVPNKQVVPGGIEIFRRFYYGRSLKELVREKITVKYDPYDLSFIYVKFGELFEKIRCVRNGFNRSSDYEMYRWQRQQKGDRDGTMTKEGAQSYGEVIKQKKQEVRLTTQEKRTRKSKKGKADYKKQAALHGHKAGGDNALDSTNVHDSPTNAHSSVSSDSVKQSGGKPKNHGKGSSKTNVLDFGSFFRKSESVDYDEPPTFYDSNKS
ncbi:Mu transposase C-terminal domain-containing protein [Pseudomonas sp. NPDC096925]|uniref:Mu transposase C-terminal domain-containing protein n=1 Tax=Pseudomonas sp. NPDC096925 TaxID=3364484 RepID=UPI00383ADA02